MIRINALSFAKLVKAIIEDDLTVQQLVDDTGLHYVTVQRYMRALHREGVIHICGWEKDSRGRDAIRVYRFGPGRDAKRKRKPGAVRAKEYRSKMRIRKVFAQAQAAYVERWNEA